MKDPRSMRPEELVAIVEGIQSILWIEVDQQGEEMWDPDKQWEVDSLDEIGELLDHYGLRPEERSPA